MHRGHERRLDRLEQGEGGEGKWRVPTPAAICEMVAAWIATGSLPFGQDQREDLSRGVSCVLLAVQLEPDHQLPREKTVGQLLAMFNKIDKAESLNYYLAEGPALPALQPEKLPPAWRTVHRAYVALGKTLPQRKPARPVDDLDGDMLRFL